MAVAVDFETFYSSDYSVSDMGIWRYVTDTRFDAYLVAVFGEGIEFVGHPKDFDWRRLHGKELVSHNASFDAFIFVHLTRIGVIPPDVGFRHWHCTANLSCYLGAPRALAHAAAQLLGMDVSKDLRKWMRGKQWADAVAEGRESELRQYALRDARACHDIWERNHARWPLHERELARLTMVFGWKGVRIDTKRVEEGIVALNRVMFEAVAQIPWAGGDDVAILSPKLLGEECRKAGIEPPSSLAEDSPECEEWENRHGSQYPWVSAMRTYRKANALLEKLKTMRSRTRPTDRCMGYELKYFGSHTGRWSGSSGFNIQNLPREEMFGVDLRACIVPRPGCKFVICDLSQIEPRILAWLCDDATLLDQISAGIPLYEAHARNTMGWKGGNLKKENPGLYALAKARVLGLGYGCGPDKFVVVAKNMGGIDLSLQEAKATVTAFRQSNRKIVALWNRLDADFKRSNGSTFEIELPSGRALSYFNVSSTGGWTAQTERGGRRVRIYGGKLTENLVQAVARDVFAEGLLRLADAGIDVAFHIHDEAVCEVPVDTDPSEIGRILTINPDWLPGCPLAAESVESGVYKK